MAYVHWRLDPHTQDLRERELEPSGVLRAQIAKNRSAIRPTFLQGRLKHSSHDDQNVRPTGQRSQRKTRAVRIKNESQVPDIYATSDVDEEQENDEHDSQFNEEERLDHQDPSDNLLENSEEQDSEQALSHMKEAPSNVAQKVQLRSRFFDIHFGATSHAPPLFVNDALDFPHPRKTALIAAMDTLCVAQLATTFQDENLIAASKILYGRAIHFLNEKISYLSRRKRVRQGELDDIVGSISALIPATWFHCVGAARGEWMRHSQGLDRVIETYGCQSLSPTVRNQFYRHWERRSFGYILLSGRAVPPRVLRESKRQNSGDSFFRSCAVKIPALLDRAREILDKSPAVKANGRAVMNMLAMLGRCVSDIKRWQLFWTAEMAQGYDVLKVAHFESFLPFCKEHKDVFPLVYSFNSIPLERDLRLSQVCLISVLQMVLDLYLKFSNLLRDREFRLSFEVAKKSAKSAADSLCCHIPWNAQSHNGSFACTYSWMPLYVTSTFYRKNGFEEELGWCQEVSKSLSSKYGITVECFQVDAE